MKTLVHEFPVSYSQTEWYFLFSLLGARKYKTCPADTIIGFVPEVAIKNHLIKKSKTYFHQPSHMHNTRNRTNSNFNTPLFNPGCSQTQKCYLYKVIPIWNSKIQRPRPLCRWCNDALLTDQCYFRVP